MFTGKEPREREAFYVCLPQRMNSSSGSCLWLFLPPLGAPGSVCRSRGGMALGRGCTPPVPAPRAHHSFSSLQVGCRSPSHSGHMPASPRSLKLRSSSRRWWLIWSTVQTPSQAAELSLQMPRLEDRMPRAQLTQPADLPGEGSPAGCPQTEEGRSKGQAGGKAEGRERPEWKEGAGREEDRTIGVSWLSNRCQGTSIPQLL